MEQPHTIPTDIVKSAGLGNSDARSLLYRQYSKAMYNNCIRMMGNRVEAEDVLQEAFLLAFKNLGQLKQPELFGGWLRRIVTNECIRFSKKMLKTTEWKDEHEEIPEEDSQAEWWMGISPDLVHEQIKSLPDGCRQVFVLYVIEDFGHGDIARQMDISESTSKSQYQRARKLLKERITQKMKIYG